MLRVIGPPAATFTLQSSPDLKNWNNGPTVTNFNGLAQIVEGPGSTSSYKFYRASFTPLPAPLSIQGLVNSPVGNATISVSGNNLYITNLGSGGQDGLTISFPPNFVGMTLGWQPLVAGDSISVGGYITEQAIGTLNGVASSVLGTVTMTKTSTTNFSFTADFSPLGVSSNTVLAFRQGQLVGQGTAPNGTAIANEIDPSGGGSGGGDFLISPCTTGIISANYGKPCASDYLISVPMDELPCGIAGATDYVTVDDLEFGDATQSTMQFTISALKITASQVPYFVITNENATLAYQGLANTSLGNAAISASGNNLYITNLGSGGQDGLSIAFPTNLTSLEVEHQELDPNDTLPVGAYLLQNTIGTGGPVTNGLLGSLTVTKVGTANYSIAADFSPIGVSTYTVQGYLQGVMVMSFTNQAGAQLGSTTNMGASDDSDYERQISTSQPDTTNRTPADTLDWNTPPNHSNPTTFTPNGGTTQSFAIDHLYVIPEHVGFSTTTTGIQLFASQIPGLTITSENATLAYQGLANTGLGSAAISASGNNLYITNLGSGGQDGLSIAAPAGLTGFDVQVLDLDPSSSLPVGAFIKQTLIGTYNGIPNSTLGTVTTTKTGATNVSVAADFSAIGAGTYSVQSYYQGTLTAQASHQTGAAVEIAAGPCTNCYHDPFGTTYSYSMNTGQFLGEDWGVAVIASFSGSAFASMDYLYISPENVSNTVTVTDMQLTASQMPGLTITSENASLVYQGLMNTSLGNAAISASGNNLYITNLGSGGQDGLAITLPPNFSSYSVSWQELDPSGTLPIGAYLQEKGIGNAPGITNGVVFSTTSTKIGSGQYAVTASFNNSNVIDVAVYSAGSLVTTVTGLSGTLCVASDGGYDVDDTIKNQPKKTYPPNTTFAFNGLGSVQGDTLVLIPETSPQISAISSIQLLTGGIPSLDIVDELASGPFTQLQVLLPGETNAPYTVTGKTGTPAPLSGGQVTCTVLAVDGNWNPVPSVTDTINITCNDPNSITPTPAPLFNGSGQFTVSFTDAGVYSIDTISALDISNTGIAPATSSQFNP